MWRLRRAWRRLTRGQGAGPADELVSTFMSGQSVRATTYHHRPTGASGGPEAWAYTEDAIRGRVGDLERQLRRALRPGLLDQLAAAIGGQEDEDAGDGYTDEEGYSDDLE